MWLMTAETDDVGGGRMEKVGDGEGEDGSGKGPQGGGLALPNIGRAGVKPRALLADLQCQVSHKEAHRLVVGERRREELALPMSGGSSTMQRYGLWGSDRVEQVVAGTANLLQQCIRSACTLMIALLFLAGSDEAVFSNFDQGGISE
jgi:hypothetical protein